MTHHISTVINAIVVGAVLTYLTTRALKTAPSVDADGTMIFRYSTALRIFGVFSSLGIIALATAVPFMAGEATQSLFSWTFGYLIASVILILGIYGLFEFPFVKIAIENDGLHGLSPWRKPRHLKWNEISSVSFSGGAQWFVIEDKDGRKIRAHLYLSGIRSLYDELRQRVPKEKWQNRYEPFEKA